MLFAVLGSLLPSVNASADISDSMSMEKLPRHVQTTPSCDVAARDQHHAFHGRRVLLVMCKRAFRGHQGVLRLLRQLGSMDVVGDTARLTVSNPPAPSDRALNEALQCSDEAVNIQHATSLAHEKNIIRSLEAAGFSVDVIISAAILCPRPKFLETQRARLVEWYGRHRLVAEPDVYKSPATQAQAMLRALKTVQEHLKRDHLRRRENRMGPLAYHSVLFWRFDIVPIHPIATVGAPTGPPLTRAAIRQLMNANATAGLYPIWAREFIASHGGDMLLSIPGWMMACALPKLAVCCSSLDAGVLRNSACDASFDARPGRQGGNFCELSFILRQLRTWSTNIPGVANPVDSGVLSARERTWVAALAFRAPPIYRGPFGIYPFAGGAMRTCHILHYRFGGPMCDARHVLAQGCEAISAAFAAKGLSGERMHMARAEWMMRLWRLSSWRPNVNATTCLATSDTPTPRSPKSFGAAMNEFVQTDIEATACLYRKEESNCTREYSDPWMHVDVLTHAAARISFRSRCPARLVTDDRLVGMTRARNLIQSGANVVESRAQLCVRLADFARTHHGVGE